MLAFVAGVLLGLRGQGPFSDCPAADADRSIAPRYEPVVRCGAPADIVPDERVLPGGDRVAVTMAKRLVVVDLFGQSASRPSRRAGRRTTAGSTSSSP